MIDQAVSLASWVESLAKRLHRPNLMTGAIAKGLPFPTKETGRHALRGVEGLVEIFSVQVDGP